MKCYYHPKEDAVAVCKTCGKCMCSGCLINIDNSSYCKSCVETGRVKVAPTEAPIQPAVSPMPSGTPSRTQFIVGGAGTTLVGIAALLTLIFGGLASALIFSGMSYSRNLYGVSIQGIVVSIILAIGIVLGGIGYLGIKRNYGASTGTAGFALSIVVCVFIFISVAFEMLAVSVDPYYRYYYYNPWYPIYAISSVITLILFGVMQVLWGAAHINTRQFTGNSGLAMATGIMLIIAGALTMTVIITFVGMILFFISTILATIVFLMAKIPQHGSQPV